MYETLCLNFRDDDVINSKIYLHSASLVNSARADRRKQRIGEAQTLDILRTKRAFLEK